MGPRSPDRGNSRPFILSVFKELQPDLRAVGPPPPAQFEICSDSAVQLVALRVLTCCERLPENLRHPGVRGHRAARARLIFFFSTYAALTPSCHGVSAKCLACSPYGADESCIPAPRAPRS